MLHRPEIRKLIPSESVLREPTARRELRRQLRTRTITLLILSKFAASGILNFTGYPYFCYYIQAGILVFI